MSRFGEIATWTAIGGGLLWAFAMGWPSRRQRQFVVETIIAAPVERVWKTVCEKPGEPETAGFNVGIASVKQVQQDPPIHEYDVDVSGYGTHFRKMRVETIEERKNEHLLVRTVELDGKAFPFGQQQRHSTTLAVGPDGTRVVLEWSGETATLGQFNALKRQHGAYLRRAKEFCETGRPPPRRAGLSLRQGLILSAMAIATFMLWLGWLGGAILTGVLILHELGHWVAMKLTGQPAPRLILIPFFGGAALANHPHKTLLRDAFCALMGPGMSAIASLAVLIAARVMVQGLKTDHAVDPGSITADRLVWLTWLFKLGVILGAINLLQLIPMLPLDGGQVLRAVMQSFHAVWARRTLLGFAGLGVIGFAAAGEPLFAGLMALGGLQAWHMSGDPPRAQPMNGGGVAVIILGYLLACAAHGAAVLSGLEWMKLGS